MLTQAAADRGGGAYWFNMCNAERKHRGPEASAATRGTAAGIMGAAEFMPLPSINATGVTDTALVEMGRSAVEWVVAD